MNPNDNDTTPAPDQAPVQPAVQPNNTPPQPPRHADSAALTPPAPIKPPKKKTNKAAVLSISILMAILLTLGIVAGVNYFERQQNASNPVTSLESGEDGNATVTNEENTIASVAAQVSPSVVSIVTRTQSRSYYGPSTSGGAGTGVIVSKDGYVLTNNHVIDGTTGVAVVDDSGRQYDDVKVVGRDPLNDIAFLKIDSDVEFKPASIGNSSTLRIGQQVIAIGNALGQYSNTVTSGIVSGVGRPITAAGSNGNTESLTDLIQTDASINPGNSGGPLLNAAGQVIGINTAIVEDANGIGFAIPINSTKGVLAGVLETGKVNRSYLGINYLTITPAVANEYDLSVNQGAYIFSQNGNPIAADGPAANSDLRQGDIITKINDETIGRQAGLASVVGQYRPGNTLSITYIRDGQERTTSITLGTYSE